MTTGSRSRYHRVRRAALGGLGALIAALTVCGTAQPAAAAPEQRTSGSSHDRRAALAGFVDRWRFDASATTLADVARVIGVDRLRPDRTGAGIGVALIDTGVVPVGGLRTGNVLNGPDLSIDSQASEVRYLDAYGHGTHLAGIITGSNRRLRGIAPDATLTSLRVGGANGAVDVTQVIAAVDWVVAHRNDDPQRPIRVLNLSYGTDGTQDYRLDPLAHAVENAWRAGITVVAAAGNGGAAAGGLTNPAADPYLIAVGAADTNGTVSTLDDTVADFSSRAATGRDVDLVAPGRSLVSLRAPGSYLDQAYPSARVDGDMFKGSGTSQAAAVVSGAVVLLLQHRPDLTPDQVKSALTRTAHRLPLAAAVGQGAGELDIARAVGAVGGKLPAARQAWVPSTGQGTLEAARGSAHIAVGDAVLTGEYDLFGPFDTVAWAKASSAGTAWDGPRWMGRELTGSGWAGAGGSWTSRTWRGQAWSGQTWNGLTWSGLTWSGLTWSGLTWSGLTWSGLTWSGLTWSGLTWSADFWS